MRRRIPDVIRPAIVLVAHSALIAGALGAQAPACSTRLLQRPPIRVAVAIEGCDYVRAIAEDQHRQPSTKCDVILRNVLADSNSRVHVVSRMLADSLRQIFAHHFGFLDWTQSQPPSAWLATAHLEQPDEGPLATFRIVLRSPEGAETRSEPFPFEKFGAINQLYTRSRGDRALDTISAQWARAAERVLDTNGHVNRDKLVRSVFAKIAIATLTRAQVAPSPRGTTMWGRIPVHDWDIRVESTSRPMFAWHVSRINGGQPPVDDRAEFELGECTSDGGYLCKMLTLRLGSALFAKEEIKQFFDVPTQLQEPIALHVIKYQPAPVPCARQGVAP
jgi:hypothetical protein